MFRRSLFWGLNLLWRPFLLHSRLKVEGGQLLTFFCSRVTCLPGSGKERNYLKCLAHLVVRNCSLRICGNGNVISLGGNITNSRIRVEGEGNEFILEESASFKDTDIVIIGTNCKIRIGKATSIGGAGMVVMGKNNMIVLGERCMLSSGIQLWASDAHAIYESASGRLLNPSGSILIGNHVWLGLNSMVLKGVSIGDESVIGMGSLITKDVPESSVCAGNPQRILRQGIRWDHKFIEE